jgi:hypothetical protein
MTDTYSKFGTAEFYASQFDDILADVQGDDPKYGDAIVDGFLKSLNDWRTYHQDQIKEYDRLEQRVRQA